MDASTRTASKKARRLSCVYCHCRILHFNIRATVLHPTSAKMTDLQFAGKSGSLYWINYTSTSWGLEFRERAFRKTCILTYILCGCQCSVWLDRISAKAIMGSNSKSLDGIAEIEPPFKFPFCLVWTQLPLISWILPMIGHVGLCDSKGTIYDFAGTQFVNTGKLSFGHPLRWFSFQCATTSQYNLIRPVKEGNFGFTFF